MKHWRSSTGAGPRGFSRRRAGRLVLVVTAAALINAVMAPAAAAATTLTVAVIGDTPYSNTQRTQFPTLVGRINSDPDVGLVLHAGDIKSGTSKCDNALFADRATLFGTFNDPFVITPGDNEWTDCHRLEAGQYVPTERLTALRKALYPQAGLTLGQNPMTVTSQAGQQQHSDYIENVEFELGGVVMATVHVVGSKNDLKPWSGLPGGDRPQERLAEFTAREAAGLAWIDAAFARATSTGAAGVLLLLQAEPVASTGFTNIRNRILQRSAEFGRPVLLVHGDEHRYETETRYGGVANLTRLETFGNTAKSWLRLKVDPQTASVFSWTPQSV